MIDGKEYAANRVVEDEHDNSTEEAKRVNSWCFNNGTGEYF